MSLLKDFQKIQIPNPFEIACSTLAVIVYSENASTDYINQIQNPLNVQLCYNTYIPEYLL